MFPQVCARAGVTPINLGCGTLIIIAIIVAVFSQADNEDLESPRGGRVLQVCVAILALLMVFTLTLFWIYGTDTHHANRNSIWWGEI